MSIFSSFLYTYPGRVNQLYTSELELLTRYSHQCPDSWIQSPALSETL